jgi:hypothetical protein
LSTRCTVASRTPGRRLSTRSTVAVETCAARAMSTTRARRASEVDADVDADVDTDVDADAEDSSGDGTGGVEGFSLIHQKPSAISLTRMMHPFIFAGP